VYTKRNRLDHTLEEQLGVRYLPFDELLAACECVSLHLRFVPETDRLMGEREFGLMRPGSLFVNTARGRLVDEAALIAALESGHLAGAALDVFWYEPLPEDSPLLSAPNLVLTPTRGAFLLRSRRCWSCRRRRGASPREVGGRPERERCRRPPRQSGRGGTTGCVG